MKTIVLKRVTICLLCIVILCGFNIILTEKTHAKTIYYIKLAPNRDGRGRYTSRIAIRKHSIVVWGSLAKTKKKNDYLGKVVKYKKWKFKITKKTKWRCHKYNDLREFKVKRSEFVGRTKVGQEYSRYSEMTLICKNKKIIKAII